MLVCWSFCMRLAFYIRPIINRNGVNSQSLKKLLPPASADWIESKIFLAVHADSGGGGAGGGYRKNGQILWSQQHTSTRTNHNILEMRTNQKILFLIFFFENESRKKHWTKEKFNRFYNWRSKKMRNKIKT